MITYLKNFFHKHEKRIGFAFLIGGFIFDSLTLKRVDLLLDNLILLFYLAVVAVGIIVINLRAGKYENFVPYAMQFAFGGLFSGFLVFYLRSASTIASLPFFLMLGVFFVGNEFFRERYKLFNFHLAVFFFAVFSYLIFSLPVLLRRMGDDVFILSGLLSLMVIVLLVYLIKKIAPKRITEHEKLMAFTIGVIYLFFNILYFTNIIPPIPLSMKEFGIYHGVERINGGNYAILRERRMWYEFWNKNKFYFLSGDNVYVYSAIFAPTQIKNQIFHQWLSYDSKNGWVLSTKIGFPIVGGRDGGYRGYSVKENIYPGKWRVDIITERGQIVGRISFEIIETNTMPELEMAIK